MYNYISGKLVENTPSYAVIDNNGIGFFINISINTYSKLDKKVDVKLYIHHVIREDAHILYGFFDIIERDMFELLISVSGVGANTARVILSSLTVDEIKLAIMGGEVEILKSIKGIGAKSAQRIIVDLRDKVGKINEEIQIFDQKDNTIKHEALSALVMLGFNKKQVEKILEKILKENNQITVEELVRECLKLL